MSPAIKGSVNIPSRSAAVGSLALVVGGGMHVAFCRRSDRP
jgi:hypothetical protein